MQWWAWIMVGAILLGAELAFVNAQFYLVFVGAAALLVGLSSLAGLNLIVLALGSLLIFRRRVYERLRPNLPGMKQVPGGDTVLLPAALPPGETCRLEYRGSSWSAINAGESVIAAGSRARIERIDGLTLVVRG
jgi:hypothetical protein